MDNTRRSGCAILAPIDPGKANPIEQKPFEIRDTDDATSLYKKMTLLGKNMLQEILPLMNSGKITGKKHWLDLLKARAIENLCYIFAPNQTGKNTKKREIKKKVK